MTDDPYDELARRQLAEARSRANGAILRRALMLVVIAGFILALGFQQDDVALAVVVAVALFVAAGLVVWRGDGFQR